MGEVERLKKVLLDEGSTNEELIASLRALEQLPLNEHFLVWAALAA